MTLLILQEAFSSLFPEKKIPELSLRYSGKFKSFNGNVYIHKEFRIITKLNFSLSKDFKDCEEDIIKGIVQHLINKVYKTTIKSIEQDLYHGFIKNMTKYAKRKESDPLLFKVFASLNEEYFDGLLDRPNMVFGQDSTTVLGHYNYSTDTVTISTILKEENKLLDFVVYHELLHKKHGFKHVGTRSQYHTKEFRAEERAFHVLDIEKKLERFVATKKIKKLLFKW